MGRIKQPQTKEHPGKIRVNSESFVELSHPIFCFKYLHRDYNLAKCTDQEKKALIDQLVLLSSQEWAALQLSGRHGIGSEKIAITSLKNVKIPYKLTDDVNHLLAFRFDGKKPIIGFRNRFIFHILFIDRDFTVYNH